MKHVTTEKLPLWLSNKFFDRYQTDLSDSPTTDKDKFKQENSKKNFQKEKSAAQEYFTKTIKSEHQENFRAALRELKATSLEKIVFGNDTDELKSNYNFPDDKQIQEKLLSLQEAYPMILPKGNYFPQFKEIFKVTKLIADFIECNNNANDETAFIHAFKMMILFGSFQKFDNFLVKHNLLKNANPVHKALQYTLPSKTEIGVKHLGLSEAPPWADFPPITHLNLDVWRKLISESGPNGYPYFTLAIQTEQVLKGHAPRSLQEAFEVMKDYQYRDWRKDPELADIFLKLRTKELNFSMVMDLKTKAKTYSNIPNVVIKGEDVNVKYSGYYLVKLPINDPRFYILGHLTACCQSIDGAAKDFVIAASQNPNVDTYILLKITKKNKNRKIKQQDPEVFKNGQIDYENYKIMGQGVIWISEKGNLTFDSWENLNPTAEDPIIIDMLQALAKEIASQEKIIRMTIGIGSAKTPKVLKEAKTVESPERIITGIQYRDSRDQVALYYDEKSNTSNLLAIEKALINILGEDVIKKYPLIISRFDYTSYSSHIVNCKIPGVQQFFKNLIKAGNFDHIYIEYYFRVLHSLEKYLSKSIWKYLESCDIYTIYIGIEPIKSLLNISVPEISNKFIETAFSYVPPPYSEKVHTFSRMKILFENYKEFTRLNLHEDKQAAALADFLSQLPDNEWVNGSNLIQYALEKFNQSKLSEDKELRLNILKYPEYSSKLIEIFENINLTDFDNFSHCRDFLFKNSSLSKKNAIIILKKWIADGLLSYAYILNTPYFSGEKSLSNLSQMTDRYKLLSDLEININPTLISLLESLDQISFENRILRVKNFKIQCLNYFSTLGNMLFSKEKLEDFIQKILDSNLPNPEMIIPLMLNNLENANTIANSFLSIHKIGLDQYTEFTKYVSECKTYEPDVGTVLVQLHEDKILIPEEKNIFSFVLNLPLEQLRNIYKSYANVKFMKELLTSPIIDAIIDNNPINRLKIHEFLFSNFHNLNEIQQIFAQEPIKNPRDFIEFVFNKGSPPVSKLRNRIKRYNQSQTLTNLQARQNFMAAEDQTLNTIFAYLVPYKLESNSTVLNQIFMKLPGDLMKICQQTISNNCYTTIKLFRRLREYISTSSTNLPKENLKILNDFTDEKKNHTVLFSNIERMVNQSESEMKIWKIAKKYSNFCEANSFNFLLVNCCELLEQCEWSASRHINVLEEILEQGLAQIERNSDAKAISQFCVEKINESCTKTILQFMKIFHALHAGSKSSGPDFSACFPSLTVKQQFSLDDYKALQSFIAGESVLPIIKMAWNTAQEYTYNFEKNMGMFKKIYAWTYHNSNTFFKTGDPDKTFTLDSVQKAPAGTRTRRIFEALKS